MGTQRVGSYELVRELGRGGDGAVWEAAAGDVEVSLATTGNAALRARRSSR